MKSLIYMTCIILFLTTFAFAGQPGRIAVASNGRDTASLVGDRIGRSSFYLLFDEKGAFLGAIPNPLREKTGRGGASPLDSLSFDENGNATGGADAFSKDEREGNRNSMMAFLNRNGIAVIVAEEFGGQIVSVMEGAGIKCVEFKGSAKDAVASILAS